MIDFSKSFNCVWHPALFHKLVSAGLPPSFVRWTQSFLSDRRACADFQNHKSCSFRVHRGVPQRSVLGSVLFSLLLMIFLLLCLLPLAVLFMLTTRPFSPLPPPPSVPDAVEATREALIQLERWSEYWCLPLNPSRPPFFQSTPPS